LPTNERLAEIGIKCIQFGCLTMAMEPGNLVIEEWAKATSGITISHDINIRAALGFDPEHERIRVERVNAFSHIVKASDEDIEWLYQGKRNVDDVASEWAQTALVLITRGADGTSIFRCNERFDVPSRKINVVDTVGAGDTFCANLIGQLQEAGYLGTDLTTMPSAELEHFVYVAGIAASITCERAGCEPPTKDDLAGVIATI
jgi:fructokinase